MFELSSISNSNATFGSFICDVFLVNVIKLSSFKSIVSSKTRGVVVSADILLPFVSSLLEAEPFDKFLFDAESYLLKILFKLVLFNIL